MYSNKQILVTECNICNIHSRNRDLLVKKRIKTRRLTNIYYSHDDDVGDGYNLLSPPLSLSLSVCPSPSSHDRRQLSHCANFFEDGILICFCHWLQPKAYFSNITVIIRVLCLARITHVQHYSRFNGMFNGTDGGRQRPSVQNIIVVLFPDMFMNFWLLSYRNLNRYVI